MNDNKIYEYFNYDFAEWAKKSSPALQYTNGRNGYITISAISTSVIYPGYHNYASTVSVPYGFNLSNGYNQAGVVIKVFDYLKSNGYKYSVRELQKVLEQEPLQEKQEQIKEYMKTRLIELWKEEK